MLGIVPASHFEDVGLISARITGRLGHPCPSFGLSAHLVPSVHCVVLLKIFDDVQQLLIVLEDVTQDVP